MQSISLQSSGRRRKQNCEIFWGGLKVTQQSGLLLFAFSPPLFFCFSCLIFFSLTRHLVGFILKRKVFRKACRILGLDERWVVEQDFHANYQVNSTWFFAFFLNCVHSGMVWKISSLYTGKQTKLSMTIKIGDVTSSTKEWIRMGAYGRLRGKWVNDSTYINFACSYEKKV